MTAVMNPPVFDPNVNGGVAGGTYIWETLADAKAFYNGPWLEGIRARYGCEPRVTYFETFAIADQERSAEIDAPFPLCLDHHSRQRFAAVAGSLRMWAIENIVQDGALSFQFGAHFCVQILQIGLRVLT